MTKTEFKLTAMAEVWLDFGETLGWIGLDQGATFGCGELTYLSAYHDLPAHRNSSSFEFRVS